MNRVDAAWLTGWAVAAAGFYVANRRNVALCATARRLFRTESVAGRAAFRLAFDTGAYALREHVLKS